MKKYKFTHILPLLGLLILTSAICPNVSGQALVKQGNPVPVNFCITPTVMELYKMINEYRQRYNLPPIQLSKSLCYIAALHVKDLSLYHPDQGPCNFHSWSGKGLWKPFCYPRDENKKNSVWDKPRELTLYPSRAYEIVYWENAPLVTDTIIMVWKTEDYFNSFLLNSGKWQGKRWNAIGIAVNENYASAWFGEEADPEGGAKVCGSTVEAQVKDTLKPVVIVKKSKVKKVKVIKTDSIVSKPADNLITEPAKPINYNDTAAKTYYIIVKTNLSLEVATKLVNTLKAENFPDAKVIARDEKIRVSVFESTSKTVVMTKLREVKKIYKDAWLYRN